MTSPLADADEVRYIVFRVGEDAFAAPLLSIKEIVDPLPYCYVPNFHDYFLGLANLRGQIMGVIDLGLRFGMASCQQEERGVLLICESESGALLGALVSRVECSISLNPKNIVNESASSIQLPSPSYLGVVRLNERILPVVSLDQLLHEAEAPLMQGA